MAAVLASLPEDAPNIQQMLLNVWVGYDIERNCSVVRVDMNSSQNSGRRLSRVMTFDEFDIHQATPEQLEQVRQDVVTAAAEMALNIRQDSDA
jgi:hypothetical protein